MIKACLFFALFALAVQAQLTNKFIIDDFGNGIGDQKAEITLSSALTTGQTPQIATSGRDYGAGCTGLTGCGRDMEMRVFSGLADRSFSSELLSSSFSEFAGEWVISNPKTSTSIASMEYDGRDAEYDGSPNADGLGGVDVTAGSTGTIFRISAVSDLDTSYDIILVDTDGDVCEFSIDIAEITGSYDLDETVFDYELEDVEDDCDVTSIDYIKVSIASDDAVDAIVRTLAIVGPPNPSATPSPSRTPSASRSRTRDPTASPTSSVTPTPSVTPTRTVSPSECICECPLFRCGLIFDVPHGDDDDNVDDDSHDDDDLVFVPVYARPFDDDFEHAYPDDDENEAISLVGGLTIDHNDDDDESANSSSVLAASATAIVLALI